MGAGTLAEQTLVPAAAVVAVDPSLPLDLAALLGCAVTTGVGAVMRTAVVRPGESVLIIGCGGVGLASIQGSRLAGADHRRRHSGRAASCRDRQRSNRHGRRESGRPPHRRPRAHRRRRGGSRDRGRRRGSHDPCGIRRHPPRRHGDAGGRRQDRRNGDVPGVVADGRRQDDAPQRLRSERPSATSRRSPSWPSAAGSIWKHW